MTEMRGPGQVAPVPRVWEGLVWGRKRQSWDHMVVDYPGVCDQQRAGNMGWQWENLQVQRGVLEQPVHMQKGLEGVDELSKREKSERRAQALCWDKCLHVSSGRRKQSWLAGQRQAGRQDQKKALGLFHRSKKVSCLKKEVSLSSNCYRKVE